MVFKFYYRFELSDVFICHYYWKHGQDSSVSEGTEQLSSDSGQEQDFCTQLQLRARVCLYTCHSCPGVHVT
jgi:hypothetical protein